MTEIKDELPPPPATDMPGLAIAEPELPKHCCGRCRFFTPATGQQPSICRRFPPTPFIVRAFYNDDQTQVTGNIQLTSFPIVTKTQWCGEFQEKPN